MTERWFLKCRKCRKPWAVDIERNPSRPYANPLLAVDWMTCPHCAYTPEQGTDKYGRLEYPYHLYPARHHIRMGKVGPKHRLLSPEDRSPCDGRCTGARGPNCDCKCGGANHGSNRVVTVWRDSGAVPKAVA